MGREFFLDRALLPEGWARDVRLTVEDGTLRKVVAGARPDGAEPLRGIAVPGVPNLHSHAFQRAMAGLAERRGPGPDSFWTWRETLYRFLARLGPEEVEAIAAYAYLRMLEAGYTAVAEFHYLHHDAEGRPYADPAEMAARIAAAAAQTGIGLTLLPVFYGHGDFGGAPAGEGQRRFLSTPDRYLDLVARSRSHAAGLPDAAVGTALHSLRAVTQAEMAGILAEPGVAASGAPIHIHAAEQLREVEACLAWSGRRPVEWLLDEAGIDARWCLVHATHMTPDETARLARSGAVAGLCPTTEANLGDGVFPAVAYLEAGGRYGIGSDSHVTLDPAEELRLLEYGQRLVRRSRNVLALAPGDSSGRALLSSALAGGAQACGRRVGALAEGRRCDLVLLDADHPDLAGRAGDQWLDGWIFVGGPALVRTVVVGGRTVVEDGRHVAREPVVARYRAALARLSGAAA